MRCNQSLNRFRNKVKKLILGMIKNSWRISRITCIIIMGIREIFVKKIFVIVVNTCVCRRSVDNKALIYLSIF